MIATGNRGKAVELQALLADSGVTVEPWQGGVAETGDTFADNALLKARAACNATGLPALADDSGLEVAALQGAPGVHSARFAPGSDAARYEKLLAMLEGVPDGERAARFVSAIALVTPEGEEQVVHGVCEGRIGRAPRGDGGFGYDPVFYLPDGRSMAELTREEKNAISHRGRALRRMLPRLARYFGLRQG